MFTRILIGVDGRFGGRDAIALACRLAARNAELTAVHVARDPGAEPRFDTRPYEALLDAELAETGARAERLVIGDRSPGRALRLATCRTGADLLVLGSSNRARLGQVFAGDTARVALHGAHCAVAVAARGLAGQAQGFHTVGVGYDGSPEAAEALGLAIELAGSAGAALRVLAVGTPSTALIETVAHGREWRSPQDARRASVEAIVAAAVRRAELRGVDATGAAVPGSAKSGLERMSADVDLLVLGSRGSGPALRTLLGSTGDRVLQAAHCPVIVVPRGAITGERPARVAA